MINALRRLERMPVEVNPRKDALATAYIHGPMGGLFATHPSMEKRIAAIRAL
jgi:Zn-dependent protease with chaperone function